MLLPIVHSTIRSPTSEATSTARNCEDHQKLMKDSLNVYTSFSCSCIFFFGREWAEKHMPVRQSAALL